MVVVKNQMRRGRFGAGRLFGETVYSAERPVVRKRRAKKKAERRVRKCRSQARGGTERAERRKERCEEALYSSASQSKTAHCSRGAMGGSGIFAAERSARRSGADDRSMSAAVPVAIGGLDGGRDVVWNFLPPGVDSFSNTVIVEVGSVLAVRASRV